MQWSVATVATKGARGAYAREEQQESGASSAHLAAKRSAAQLMGHNRVAHACLAPSVHLSYNFIAKPPTKPLSQKERERGRDREIANKKKNTEQILSAHSSALFI